MFSRLGVFIGCEGECREALIVDESDGVLQERCLAGWKEREVRMSLLSIIRPQAAGNIEAPLPAVTVGYVGLLCFVVEHSAPARFCAQLSPLLLGYNGAKWHLAVELPKLPLQFYASHRGG